MRQHGSASLSEHRRAQPSRTGSPGLTRDANWLQAILSLQRSAGNRAVGRLLEAQRFTTITSADYAVATESERNPFTVQGEVIEVVERPEERPGLGMKYPITTPATPNLHVANDHTLAINAAGGEPKEFYAHAATVDAANTQLQAVASPIELYNVANTITLPEATSPEGEVLIPRKVLTMVQPRVRGNPEPGARAFAALGADICRDMAKYVMGGAITHAVVGSGATRTDIPIETTHGTRVGGTQELGQGLAAGNVSVGEAKGLMGANGPTPTPGRAYGEALHGGQVAIRGAALRINERAKALVGGGYVTQTIEASTDEGGPKREYAADEAFDRPFVWGYHFGAVVAESTDKADQILLENYARESSLKAGQTRLLTELRERFAVQLLGAALVENTPAKQIGEILRILGDPAPNAVAAYTAMREEQIAKLKELWYFRMVGEGAGQSFHEQMRSSGSFANPLTMAVANMRFKAPVRIKFVGGVSALPVGANKSIQDLARAALLDRSQGRHLTNIRVTGYSSGTWKPWEARGIGGRRAEAVGAAFHQVAGGAPPIAEVDGGITTKFGAVTADNNVAEITADG